MTSQSKIPSLYEWAGGLQKFEELFEAFYQKVRLDEILQPVFQDMPGHHWKTVAHFVAEVFGGPSVYSSQPDHSHATMVARHVGKHLTERQRQRWLALLLQTADEVGIPDDPEFRSALLAYLEWGSRIAKINSHALENPIGPAEPMPKWGWGEVKGPYLP